MRVLLRLIGLCSLCLLTGCGGPQEPDRTAPQPFEGRGFSATLRKDVLHNAITPEPAVTLYDFHIGSQPLLFFYVGDHPGYPRYTWKPEKEEDRTLASGLHAHCRQARDSAGRARECVIELGPRSPKKLHAFYEALAPETAGIADEIIQSVAPRAQ